MSINYEVQLDLIVALKLLMQMQEFVKRSVMKGLEPSAIEMATWNARTQRLLEKYPNVRI